MQCFFLCGLLGMQPTQYLAICRSTRWTHHARAYRTQSIPTSTPWDVLSRCRTLRSLKTRQAGEWVPSSFACNVLFRFLNISESVISDALSEITVPACSSLHSCSHLEIAQSWRQKLSPNRWAPSVSVSRTHRRDIPSWILRSILQRRAHRGNGKTKREDSKRRGRAIRNTLKNSDTEFSVG